MSVYTQFDVVKVPFPFTELPFTKRRPAVVLSDIASFRFEEGVPKIVLAMITSNKHKQWPLDTPLTALKEAGLSQDSLIRLKIFTLDSSLILAKIGRLIKKDSERLSANLRSLLAMGENARA
jgi:mRNA interferase MazF